MAGEHVSDSFEVTGEQIRRALSGKRIALTEEFHRVFRRDGVRWQEGMAPRLRGPLVLGQAKSPTALLASRRPAAGLAGSLFAEVLGSGRGLDDLRLVKGSTSHYAKVHELGTVGAGGKLPDIVPVRRQWLTIPTQRAMTPSGVPRRAGARSWPGLRFFPGKPKNGEERAYLVGPGGLAEIFYVLVKRTAVAPRMGMVDTHVSHAEKRRKDVMVAIRKAFSA